MGEESSKIKMSSEELENIQDAEFASWFLENKNNIISWRKNSESLASSIKITVIVGVPAGIAITFLANSIFSLLKIDASLILLISSISLGFVLYFGYSIWKETKEEISTLEDVFSEGARRLNKFTQKHKEKSKVI